MHDSTNSPSPFLRSGGSLSGYGAGSFRVDSHAVRTYYHANKREWNAAEGFERAQRKLSRRDSLRSN